MALISTGAPPSPSSSTAAAGATTPPCSPAPSTARGLWREVTEIAAEHDLEVAVLSGGVFQNRLLLSEIARLAEDRAQDPGIEVWTHRRVPPNDGGISLGQAALASVAAATTAPGED